jgi:OOP family OmpA-OmpF porin
LISFPEIEGDPFMRTRSIKLVGLAMIVVLIMPGLIVTNVLAAEVMVQQVPVQKVRVVQEVVKTADNVIVLFDASGSMQDLYKDTNMKKINLAETMFKERTARVPDLDWNVGLYLYTPWKAFYEMQPFNKEKFAAAIDEMEAYQPPLSYRNQPSPLGEAIMNLDPILAKLSGKTVVFVFSDGQYTMGERKIGPVPAAKEIASKYDVSFYVISSAQSPKAEKLVNDLASVNTASRVVTFDTLLDRPEYMTGVIYMVIDKAIVETELISKVVGVELDNILFDFGKADIRPEYHDKLDTLAKFLEKNPEAYVVIEGFTDSIGDPKFNLKLSQLRAESVKSYMIYLAQNYTYLLAQKDPNIVEKRLVTVWHGKELPVASNDTAEGRRLNRRVRLTVRGL